MKKKNFQRLKVQSNISKSQILQYKAIKKSKITQKNKYKDIQQMHYPTKICRSTTQSC